MVALSTGVTDASVQGVGNAPYRVVTEVPYYELVQFLRESEVAQRLQDAPDMSYLIYVACRANNVDMNFTVHVNDGSGYEDRNTQDFSPYVVFSQAAGYVDTVLSFSDSDLLENVTTGTHAYLNGELVRVDAVDEDTLTVGRGVLDTLP